MNTLLRKVYKQPLGLPSYTSNDCFFKLGLQNTVDELIEGHLLSQRYRLSKRDAGRALLLRLGMNIHDRPLESTENIPGELRQNITVVLLPRNMHPQFHEGRREARVRAMEKKYGSNEKVY